MFAFALLVFTTTVYADVTRKLAYSGRSISIENHISAANREIELLNSRFINNVIDFVNPYGKFI